MRSPLPGSRPPWIVVGGGVSGIAAAHYLRLAGREVVLVEKEGALGGRVGSTPFGDARIDLGGKNIGKSYGYFRDFVRHLGGARFEPFGFNSAQERAGRLVTVDASTRWRRAASLLRGAGVSDCTLLARIAWNVKRSEEAGFLGSPLSRHLGERYDALPASHHFGDIPKRHVIRPMVVRMNGAEPDEAYVGNLGANLRMAFDSYEQLEGGMGPLLERFTNTLSVRLRSEVAHIDVRDGRATTVRIRRRGGDEDVPCSGVILALPARQSAKLVAEHWPRTASLLESIVYFPVTLVVAEYDRAVFTKQTRAIAFDEDAAISNAGAFSPNARNVVRYTFSGRTGRRLVEQATDVELLAEAEAALNCYVPVPRDGPSRVAVKRYQLGLCAHRANHYEWLTRLRSQSHDSGGVHLTGDYIKGASIEACFRASHDCVTSILQEPATKARPTPSSPLQPQEAA